MFSFLAAGEMGFRVSLHGSNPEPLMSAMHQLRQLGDIRRNPPRLGRMYAVAALQTAKPSVHE
jgi:hypothetical protein